jgi:hypothetical protein
MQHCFCSGAYLGGHFLMAILAVISQTMPCIAQLVHILPTVQCSFVWKKELLELANHWMRKQKIFSRQ